MICNRWSIQCQSCGVIVARVGVDSVEPHKRNERWCIGGYRSIAWHIAEHKAAKKRLGFKRRNRKCLSHMVWPAISDCEGEGTWGLTCWFDDEPVEPWQVGACERLVGRCL